MDPIVLDELGSMLNGQTEMICTEALKDKISYEGVVYAMEQLDLLGVGIGKCVAEFCRVFDSELLDCRTWADIWNKDRIIELLWNNPGFRYLQRTYKRLTQEMLNSKNALNWIVDQTRNELYLPIRRMRDVSVVRKCWEEKMVVLQDVNIAQYVVPAGVNQVMVICIGAGGAGGAYVTTNAAFSGGKGGENGGLGGGINTYSYISGGGGGAGGYRIHTLEVSPGETIPIAVAPQSVASTISVVNGTDSIFGQVTGENLLSQKHILLDFAQGDPWRESDKNKNGSSGGDGPGNGGKGGTDYRSIGGGGAGGFWVKVQGANTRFGKGGKGANYSDAGNCVGENGKQGCIILIPCQSVK